MSSCYERGSWSLRPPFCGGRHVYSGIFSCICAYLRRPEVNPGVRHCSAWFRSVDLSLTWILLRHNHLLLLLQPWVYMHRQPWCKLREWKSSHRACKANTLLTEPAAQSINPFMALIQHMISSFQAYSHPRDPGSLYQWNSLRRHTFLQ